MEIIAAWKIYANRLEIIAKWWKPNYHKSITNHNYIINQAQMNLIYHKSSKLQRKYHTLGKHE